MGVDLMDGKRKQFEETIALECLTTKFIAFRRQLVYFLENKHRCRLAPIRLYSCCRPLLG